MRLIALSFPFYRLQHENGTIFDVEARKEDDGRLSFEPLKGWNKLSEETQQPSELLLEQIDDCVFNATPDKYEVDV